MDPHQGGGLPSLSQYCIAVESLRVQDFAATAFSYHQHRENSWR
jgi:hypothetical protein